MDKDIWVDCRQCGISLICVDGAGLDPAERIGSKCEGHEYVVWGSKEPSNDR